MREKTQGKIYRKMREKNIGIYRGKMRELKT